MISPSIREACFLVESIDNALLQLEIFKGKAAHAIPMLQQVIADLNDGGLEERDTFRVRLLESLIAHLKQLHDMED